MSPYVRNLMRETGKNEKEVQVAWRKAQELTAENFGVDVDEFERRQYEYAVETAKRLLGFQEKSTIKNFYESDKSATEYISEVMTSGSIGADLDHATMRNTKGMAPGAMADNEDEERTSKEYDTVDVFDEPANDGEGWGEEVDHEDGPEYDENESY